MDSRNPAPGAPLRISIALPVHNEARSLAAVVADVETVMAALQPAAWELVIVDDGSDDGSAQIIAAIKARLSNVTTAAHQTRRGFAAVQQSCYRASRFDWIFLLPADGQIAPAELEKLLAHRHEYDIVCGCVARSPEGARRTFFSLGYHALAAWLFDLKLGRFGACLLVKREIVQTIPIRSQTPVAMTELLVKARKNGAKIVGVEVQKRPRAHGAGLGGSLLPDSLRILKDLLTLKLEAR